MHDQPSTPRRSDLAAAVSSTEQFRAHGAELHVALRCHDHNHAGRLTTDSVCRAQRHGIPLIDGSHAASTHDLGGSYPQSAKSAAVGQVGACVGIALVLATALTDLPMRLVLAIVEAMR